MKKLDLMELIREAVREEMELESQASDAAKQQGLEYMGFGRYGKDGKVTHKSERGRLVPTVSADVGLRPGKTKGSKDKMYKPGSSRAVAKVVKGGPHKGKLRRIDPPVSYATQRRRNEPQDVLARRTDAQRGRRNIDNLQIRLRDKVLDKVDKAGLETGTYKPDQLLDRLGMKTRNKKSNDTLLKFFDDNLNYMRRYGINKNDDGTYSVNDQNT